MQSLLLIQNVEACSASRATTIRARVGVIDGEHYSFPLSVSERVIGSGPSLCHPFTHSFTAAAGQPGLSSEQQHCPLLAAVICHLDKSMSCLKNEHIVQFLTLTFFRIYKWCFLLINVRLKGDLFLVSTTATSGRNSVEMALVGERQGWTWVPGGE